MNGSSTLYDALGVAPYATPDEVRRAWRRTARVTHPDVGGDADAFDRAQRAWRTLADASSRAAYDRSLRADAPIPGSASGCGYEDVWHPDPPTPEPPRARRPPEPSGPPRPPGPTGPSTADPPAASHRRPGVRSWRGRIGTRARRLRASGAQLLADATLAARSLAVVSLVAVVLLGILHLTGSPADDVELWLPVVLACALRRGSRATSGLVVLAIELMLLIASPGVFLEQVPSDQGPVHASAWVGLSYVVAIVSMAAAGELVRRRRGRRQDDEDGAALALLWWHLRDLSRRGGGSLQLVLMSQPSYSTSHVLLDDGYGARRTTVIWGRWLPGTWIVLDSAGSVQGWAFEECRVAAEARS